MKLIAVWMLAILLAAAPLALAQQPPAAPAPAPVPAIGTEDIDDARALVSERFFDLAMGYAHTRASRGTLHQTATLLDAASQVIPDIRKDDKLRYLRHLAIVHTQAGDTTPAIEAWGRYRKLVPEDEVAAIALIDLYISRMQNNGDKIAYLKSLLPIDTIDEHVKAAIAVRLVPLVDERSHNEAIAMLAEARKHYPLPEVTLLEWRMMPANATAEQKLTALLNIVRANPLNTDAVARVADMLAAAGYSQDALRWYSILIDIHAANGTEPDESSIINYWTELYRGGEPTVAAEKIDAVLQRFPDLTNAWFLRLTIARADESASMLKQAQQAFLIQVNNICEEVLKQPLNGAHLPASTTRPVLLSSATTEPAATQPTQPGDQPPPPLAATVARVQRINNPQVTEAFAVKVADLAWFELYFDHNPAAAQPDLDALKAVLPADNVVLRRLQGWYALSTGDEKSARAVFTAQEATDPLSALGLFRLEDQANHNTQSAAVGAKILSDPHTGVIGAILYQACKGRGLQPTTQPASVTALKTALDQFPKDWLQVAHSPFRFYGIRVEPVEVGHPLGDAMVAQVTLHNQSVLDLTIGDVGLIQPNIYFDAQIRDLNAQNFPGIAIDRLMGQFVLGPGESITQYVRLDQAELNQALRGRPASPMRVIGDVITNAQYFGPQLRATAGGYARNFNKWFSRNAHSLDKDRERRQLLDELATGTPRQKMLDVELLAAYVSYYTHPGATPAEKAFALQYLALIDKARADNAPYVRLWASYAEAILVAGPDELRIINDMMASTSWETRLMGLAAARLLPVDEARRVATAASTDKDPLVRQFATQMVAMIPVATTKPAALAPAGTPAPK